MKNEKPRETFGKTFLKIGFFFFIRLQELEFLKKFFKETFIAKPFEPSSFNVCIVLLKFFFLYFYFSDIVTSDLIYIYILSLKGFNQERKLYKFLRRKKN